MRDGARFLSGLQEACQAGGNGAPAERLFMTWDQARTMYEGGMAIGSHTHRHEILSRLDEEAQLEELIVSREIIQSKAGVRVETLAYPVGSEASFNQAAKNAIERAGYRAAFSYYGGFNLPGAMERYNPRRRAVNGQSYALFQMQLRLGAATGKLWI
jgi:peptidoglycan/xylan/chitin deacetylase (PgdA/CDA1 family)